MRRDTKIAAAVLAPVPLVILAAAAACTFAIAHGASMRWRALFLVMCHGIPSRCLALWGVPMPLCARCVAFYAGLFAGLALFTAVPWVSERLLRAFVFATALPLAVDGITQALRLRESTNTLRIATGATLGLAFGMWALSAIERRSHAIVTTS